MSAPITVSGGFMPEQAPKHWPRELFAMLPGQPQREQRAQRLRERLVPRRKVAKALEQTSMRVPVYFHELAVATRLALFGYGDDLAQAMSRHNKHLVKCGVKGDFETAQ